MKQTNKPIKNLLDWELEERQKPSPSQKWKKNKKPNILPIDKECFESWTIQFLAKAILKFRINEGLKFEYMYI